MAFTTSVKTKGGKKIKAIMAKAEQNRGKKIKVGFFSASAYPDGTKTALVAAAQEFGLAGLPERPFFRQAIAIIEKELPRQLRGIINPETMEISAGDAARIGRFAVDTIQARINDLTDPKNAETTILRKGSDNPLVDTGELHDAVDYEAE